MHIANCNGDFECHSWHELKNLIERSCLNPFDDMWLNGDTDYPCLAILINGNYACIHYFLNDEGDFWQSIGYGAEEVAFVSNGEQSDMPADSVIPVDKALECAKQFFETGGRPSCIEWRRL